MLGTELHCNSLGLADKIASGNTNAGVEVHCTVGLTTLAISTGGSKDTTRKNGVRASNAKTLRFGTPEGNEGSGKDCEESSEMH